MALEVRDMVLVHVITFKGCHKMQDQWENREYVVESTPIPMYQSMWYAPGMGKGAGGPYIGTICFLVARTQSRVRWTSQWQELGMTPHQLQHHL